MQGTDFAIPELHPFYADAYAYGGGVQFSLSLVTLLNQNALQLEPERPLNIRRLLLP